MSRLRRWWETVRIGLAAGLLPVGFSYVVHGTVEQSAPDFNGGQLTLVTVMALVGLVFAWLSRESGHSRLTRFAVAAATPALLVSTISGVQGAICNREYRKLSEQIPRVGDALSPRAQQSAAWPQLLRGATVFAAEQPDQAGASFETEVREFKVPAPTFLQEFLRVQPTPEYVVQVGDARDKAGATQLQHDLTQEHQERSFVFHVFRSDGRYVVTVGDQSALPSAMDRWVQAVRTGITDATLRRISP